MHRTSEDAAQSSGRQWDLADTGALKQIPLAATSPLAGTVRSVLLHAIHDEHECNLTIT